MAITRKDFIHGVSLLGIPIFAKLESVQSNKDFEFPPAGARGTVCVGFPPTVIGNDFPRILSRFYFNCSFT